MLYYYFRHLSDCRSVGSDGKSCLLSHHEEGVEGDARAMRTNAVCKLFFSSELKLLVLPSLCAQRSFAIISFAHSDAPAMPTTSARSMTFG